MTRPIKTLNVKPRVPEALGALSELSHNLWFVWHHEARDLFNRMNRDLWEESRKNPVDLLARMKQEDLENLAGEEGFLAHLERVKQGLDRYLSEKPDPRIFGESGQPFQVAYFTAECGVADCLSIYSGGLGILSGDHLKSASDLNLPVIGVSLAYQKGYFRQYLNPEGWQMETYPVNLFNNLPIRLVRDPQGQPLRLSVELKGEAVAVQIWQVQVGRISLFLLDTNLELNSGWAREITAELYGGDRETRIRQEVVLGIGGVRALRALGLKPAVFHMNEGHSAFAIFERIRELHQDHGLSFNEAVESVRASSVFTTHTPVPAGIDTFHPDLMRDYFDGFARSMGISIDVLLGYGRQDPRNRTEHFCMAVLALRLSNWNNAVSRLHGRVSRRMWQSIWPKTPEIDLPISHITNGVHIPSWISPGMAENYDRYLGPRWSEDPDNVKIWEGANRIPDTELWRTHERTRERLVSFARGRLKRQLARRGASDRELAVADEVLNSEALTIGFARRFATYKRADLILRDPDRLERILNNEKHPAQIIVAGKAHPQDQTGKEIIKHLVRVCSRERLRRRLVFLEDYDMDIARRLVQGVDVWLNTPRRPLEACGTSGMKAVANGALHFSVLDGWWEEGFDRELGWSIGRGEEYADAVFQDEIESRALYDILEKEIVPLFYDRGPEGIPRRWVRMMKTSIHRLCPMFNTHRMVEEYWDRFYVPAAERSRQLRAEDSSGLRSLTQWRERIMFNWSKVAIRAIRMDETEEVDVGSGYHVETDVFLGELAPEDILAEAYFGRLDPADQFLDRYTQVMQPGPGPEPQTCRYACDIRFEESGHFGLNVRLTPNHPNRESRHAMGLVVWGEK